MEYKIALKWSDPRRQWQRHPLTSANLCRVAERAERYPAAIVIESDGRPIRTLTADERATLIEVGRRYDLAREIVANIEARGMK